jgi:type VI protein secretion system component Hcp
MKKISSTKHVTSGEDDNDKTINSYRDDEEEAKKGEAIRLNFKHVQAKTVESNSSSSNELDEEAV